MPTNLGQEELPALPSAPSLVLLHKSASTCQHIVLGDLSGRPQGKAGATNLFGLAAPVQSDVAQTRGYSIAPVAAAHARSAQVDRDGIGTKLRPQCLADYGTRLK